MSAGKVLLGVLAGVAAGALLGVLLAPDKGTVTRKKITDKGEDVTDELKEKFNDFIEMMTDKYESVKDDGKEMIKKGKAKAEDIKKDLDHSMS